MPIYAYRCERCGHELDALQKISDPALADCPACGEASLQKKLTAPGFQLKGSGWYQTDFRGGAKPAAAAATDAPSETKAESKTESKTDAPAPSTGCGSGCSCH
ncbi:MAG: zinc ribbon domain-containing protein [Betaproteobacteria bacterium]|nr:zinc ribbon domain-containing protein [Betaproteobacteria bacterium]